MKFFINFFLSFCSFLGGRGLNQLPNTRRTCLLCWRRTVLALETNTLLAEDEHFSAGDQRVENARSNFMQPHTHTASYQRLPNRSYVEMIATHKYSPPKTDGITLAYSPPSIRYQEYIRAECATKSTVYATKSTYVRSAEAPSKAPSKALT